MYRPPSWIWQLGRLLQIFGIIAVIQVNAIWIKCGVVVCWLAALAGAILTWGLIMEWYGIKDLFDR